MAVSPHPSESFQRLFVKPIIKDPWGVVERTLIPTPLPEQHPSANQPPLGEAVWSGIKDRYSGGAIYRDLAMGAAFHALFRAIQRNALLKGVGGVALTSLMLCQVAGLIGTLIVTAQNRRRSTAEFGAAIAEAICFGGEALLGGVSFKLSQTAPVQQIAAQYANSWVGVILGLFFGPVGPLMVHVPTPSHRHAVPKIDQEGIVQAVLSDMRGLELLDDRVPHDEVKKTLVSLLEKVGKRENTLAVAIALKLPNNPSIARLVFQARFAKGRDGAPWTLRLYLEELRWRDSWSRRLSVTRYKKTCLINQTTGEIDLSGPMRLNRSFEDQILKVWAMGPRFDVFYRSSLFLGNPSLETVYPPSNFSVHRFYPGELYSWGSHLKKAREKLPGINLEQGWLPRFPRGLNEMEDLCLRVLGENGYNRTAKKSGVVRIHIPLAKADAPSWVDNPQESYARLEARFLYPTDQPPTLLIVEKTGPIDNALLSVKYKATPLEEVGGS